MGEFVAEQYVSRTDAAAATDGINAVRLAAEQLSREGTPVELVRSLFIPEDETCIYIFKADSIDAVRAALARIPLSCERISEAMTETGVLPA